MIRAGTRNDLDVQNSEAGRGAEEDEVDTGEDVDNREEGEVLVAPVRGMKSTCSANDEEAPSEESAEAEAGHSYGGGDNGDPSSIGAHEAVELLAELAAPCELCSIAAFAQQAPEGLKEKGRCKAAAGNQP